MIHQIVFAQMGQQVPLFANGSTITTNWGEKPKKYINAWDLLKGLLTHTDDHVVWIITTDQLPSYLAQIKQHDLEKYLVVDQRDKDGKPQGTTNRNYPERPRRLKVFIMKGAK